MIGTSNCRQCLHENTPDGMRLQEIIQERVRLLPEDETVSAAEYARRLALCKACDQLISGTCAQCGCYVEIRAAKRNMRCAYARPKW